MAVNKNRNKGEIEIYEDDAIVLDNVTKSYQVSNVLKGISLRIKKGEFVFIVGDSGSGKSTLIKLLLRELKSTTGTVYVLGENLNTLKRRKVPALRRKLGVVFQDFRLLKNMNVYENVAFAQQITQVPESRIRRNVPAILSRVGLAGRYKAKPRQLSGGEQQRVALARALVNKPEILLCDEPTGALDYNTGKQILQLLQDTCRREGITVVLITHNSAIAPMADRLIRFKSGKVIEMSVNKNPVSIADIEW